MAEKETARIRVANMGPSFDGEYDLDQDEALTTREWRWVKQISGYTRGNIDEGFAARDPDLYLSLAVIAMRRSGKLARDEVLEAADRMSDFPFDDKHVLLIFPDGDAGPPESTAEPES